MGAPGRLFMDWLQAIFAQPGRGGRPLLLFLGHYPHYDLQKEEYAKGHEDKVNHRLKEQSVVQRARPGGSGCFQGRVALPVQRKECAGHVGSAQHKANQWHKDIVDQGGDDFAESAADHDAYSQVQDISLECEGLEIMQELFHWYASYKII